MFSVFPERPFQRDLWWVGVFGVVAIVNGVQEGVRSGLNSFVGGSCTLLVFFHVNSYLARRGVTGFVRYPLCVLASIAAMAVVFAASVLVAGA